MGGAHVLLALFGYNLSRFALSAHSTRARIRALGRTAREVAVPAVVWIGGVAIADGRYDASTALLLNNVVGERGWSEQWHFWFLETAVWSTVGLIAVVSVPVVSRMLVRHQLVVAVAVLAAALVWRELADDSTTALHFYSIGRSAWCIALGWVIHAARSTPQRVLATALVPLTVHGFFPDDHPREWLVMAGLVLLVWVTRVVVPRPFDKIVVVIGGASLFVYLTHWLVYPHLEVDHQLLAWSASMATGVVAWRCYTTARRLLGVGAARTRAALAAATR
jgi:fucose 4-O-acetylase-like acetyltransferase